MRLAVTISFFMFGRMCKQHYWLTILNCCDKSTKEVLLLAKCIVCFKKICTPLYISKKIAAEFYHAFIYVGSRDVPA